MSQHDEVCEHGIGWSNYCSKCAKGKRMIGIKEVIELGQEAAAWITGDPDIGKEVKTLDDATKAIKTALELGRESHHQLYNAKDIIYSLRLGTDKNKCWCQMAIGNPMCKDHSNACKQAQVFMGDYK